jgi:uncharacterized membrane protein (DUF4010 family)
MTDPAFLQLGMALLLGLLVGLQRQRTESSLAGIRTFPLITLLGSVCALLAAQYAGWVVAAGFLAVAAAFVVGYHARSQSSASDPGLTTEMAGLLMYGVGAYLVLGNMAVAVALGGVVAVLLQLKRPLHEFAGRLGENDIKAIMQFVLVTMVILPVLPNRTFGPYQVLNPFKIWLLVVLIVGIGLVGYVVYKLFSATTGTLLSGLLGGVISSTATTASYARRSADVPGSAPHSALVIMIASATVYLRVLIEIGAVASGRFALLAPPLVAMLAACLVIVLGAYAFARRHPAQMPSHANPAEMKSALLFGALFAVILLAVAAARQHLGVKGLYAVAVLSGLTDMDAITLSTAQLVADGRIVPTNGWRVILLASMSNLVFKAGVVLLLGQRALFRQIAILFGLALAAGAAILWYWPGLR